MSNTFKPGDRVRRLYYAYAGAEVGGEYTVSHADNMAVTLEDMGDKLYFSGYFELVVPATPEFQVGDRVRAASKEGDDLAEFTVLHLDRDGSMTSERNYFEGGEWDFELISRPEPPKPSLPTKEGSVIRILEWMGDAEGNWIALLTRGGWRVSVDRSMAYPAEEMTRLTTDFEVIYEPEN